MAVCCSGLDTVRSDRGRGYERDLRISVWECLPFVMWQSRNLCCYHFQIKAAFRIWCCDPHMRTLVTENTWVNGDSIGINTGNKWHFSVKGISFHFAVKIERFLPYMYFFSEQWRLRSIWLVFYDGILRSVTVIKVGRGSSVGKATGYRLDGPGIESRWGGEIFRTRPDRPWGPPNLLYSGYLVFPGGKERPGRDADPSPSSSAVVMKG